jgi:uncharacterized spore protein YtfJ
MTAETPVRPTNQIPRRRTDELLTTLVDRIGGHFTASTVFGSPVERAGVTVIPVASWCFGFGGGGGQDTTEQAAERGGEGGGGGGIGAPLGHIEIKDGSSRFVPVVHPARMVAILCTTAVAVGLLRRPRRVREFHGRGIRAVAR